MDGHDELDGRGTTRRTALTGLAGAAGGVALALASGWADGAAAAAGVRPPRLADVRTADPAAVRARYARRRPARWGEHLPGILSALPVTHVLRGGRRRPVAALTFDACGNPRSGSSGYDRALVETLRRHHVPATLFLSGRWIAKNPAVAADLAADPLFEIGNHGTRHVPLSVTGRAAYGIRGTRDAAAAVAEVWGNTLGLEAVSGHRPRLFRCGTALYDDVGVAICRSLGQRPVAYTVNADAGASLPAREVARQLHGLRPGGISIGHVNHPERWTAEGLARALPGLLDAGWVFVRIGDVV